MRISGLSFLGEDFSQKQKLKEKEAGNPITKKGESSKLVKGTFIAGLGIGAGYLFDFYALDGSMLALDFVEAGRKTANKNFMNCSKGKRIFAAIAATVGFAGLFTACVGGIYTLLNSPKISYNSKLNTFKKSKEMDVYIKNNEIEKGLYEQIGESAKGATKEEKANLKEQYLLLKSVKNQVPEFAQF